jgi:hypothetical protein
MNGDETKIDLGFVTLYTYDLVNANDGRRAARYLIRVIEKNISTIPEDLNYIDTLLGVIDVDKLDDRCMAVILRCTFRVKHHCPNWKLLFEKIKMEMIKRGMDYESLLIGLI